MFAMYISTGGMKENKQMNVQHQTWSPLTDMSYQKYLRTTLV